MKAIKGNKEYAIEGAQQKGYQDMGFDIIDDEGKTIAYGRGKTVPYGDYVAAVREIERLRGGLDGPRGKTEGKTGAKKGE